MIMTKNETVVLSILTQHRGRENAITVLKVAQTAGITPREVRHIVRSLRMAHHVAIGSETGSPGGYFIAVTDKELLATIERWYKMGLKHLSMCYKLQGICYSEFVDQAALDLKESLNET